MLQFQTDTELHNKEMASIEEGKQAGKPILLHLAAHVKKSFEDAQLHRRTTGVTDRLLKSQRLKSGEYDPNQQAAIQAKGGSQLFFNITEPKCEAFQAWMEDVFTPTDDRSWDLSATPMPTLPEEYGEDIIQASVAQFAEMEGVDPSVVSEFASQMYDEMMKQLKEESQSRIDRMIQKIEDQTAEGKWDEALSDFIDDLGTFPSAILKGPVFKMTKRLTYENGEVTTTEETIPTWRTVDPMNFYPGPNCTCVSDSYLCEEFTIDKADLALMRGVDGWDENAINAIISAPDGYANDIATDLTSNETASMEDRDTTVNAGYPTNSVRAIEFWGSVPGYMLKQWGSKDKIDDEYAYYDVQCVLIGNLIVLAKLNPDPLSRRPYYVDSYVHNKKSIWGLKSIPEKMEDCQEGVNGAMRNMMNNVAFAAGPMRTFDIEAIAPQYLAKMQGPTPWASIGIKGSQTKGRPPIEYYQPNSHAREFMEIAEYYEKKADDRTLIPRYVTGDESIGGAGQTASGLSMLMGASSRGIKRVIKSSDKRIIHEAIERMYNWNMLNSEDDELKGDAQVVARGALALLVKEQTQLRRQEFLNMTNNPTDLEIIGIEGRATVLREVAKNLDMPVDKVVPPDDELRQRYNESMGQQEQTPQQEQAPQ